MAKTRAGSEGRIGRASASSLSAAEIRAVARRLGFVALKVHETVMSRLRQDSDQRLAEAFNDVFKPIVDLLLHFDLETSDDPEE